MWQSFSIEVKTKLKSLKFESMGINNTILINDSLCGYYKRLWAKCKRMSMNKFIHGFWVSYGLVKIEMSESSAPCIIKFNTRCGFRNNVSMESITEGHFKALSEYRS